MRYLIYASLSLIISTSVASAADLTGDQIKEKLIGHTLKWKAEKYKVSGVTKYNADGTATSNMDGKPEVAGTWRIKGNNLCDKFGKQKESCTTRIDQIDDKVFYLEPYQAVSIIVD